MSGHFCGQEEVLTTQRVFSGGKRLRRAGEGHSQPRGGPHAQHPVLALRVWPGQRWEKLN